MDTAAVRDEGRPPDCDGHSRHRLRAARIPHGPRGGWNDPHRAIGRDQTIHHAAGHTDNGLWPGALSYREAEDRPGAPWTRGEVEPLAVRGKMRTSARSRARSENRCLAVSSLVRSGGSSLINRRRPFEAGIGGCVDDALAELADDLIRPEGGAGREGHGEAILPLGLWRAGNMLGWMCVSTRARPVAPRRSLPPPRRRPTFCAPSVESSARPRLRIMLCGQANAIRAPGARLPTEGGRTTRGSPRRRGPDGCESCSVRTTELNEDR